MAGTLGDGQLRFHRVALVDRNRAARGERAAGRQVDHLGRIAVDGGEGTARGALRPGFVQPRDRAEQADGVRHPRPVVDLVHRARLDRLARVHDLHAVGETGDDTEVMGDHDDGGAGDLLGGLEHLQDLGLDGHIQGGGGLVGDDDLGVVGDGHGDHRALAHTAGELVGERVHPALGVGDADHVEEVDGPFAGDLLVQRLMGLDGLDDLVADGVDGGQRGQRVLEDHADVLAADLRHGGVAEAEQFAPGELDRPGDLGALGEQPEYGHGRDGLSGAGLADDAEHLARTHGVGDAAYGLHVARFAREGDRQIADVEDGLRRVGSLGGLGRPGLGHRRGPSWGARCAGYWC